ncbi:MAG TPA: hypothetical protein VFV34_22900 [Blastocatellia bacterium]|nr:hypothetical protein [Blastocatellia bacterium]
MSRKTLSVLMTFISLALCAVVVSCLKCGLDGTVHADVGSDANDRRSPSRNVVTYSGDVAPIIFSKCAVCHRPGEVAPMSLLTYREARPWARSIKEKVLSGAMPPWHADPAYGKFQNDRRLSRSEVDTIVAWVDGGAQEGDPRQLPPAPRFTEGWKIGKPDVVFTMPARFEVPAEGVIDYKYFYIPTRFTEDRWVQAAEVRVGNRAVVHHVIVFAKHPQDKSADGEGSGLEALTGVAPGEDPVVLPDGVGMRVRAGSILVLQVHYTPNGVAQSDQTSVGLIFNKKSVVKESMGGAAMNTRFAIPPGDPAHEVRSSYSVDADCHITTLMPHMHVRGKDFQYRLIYPDGASKILLSVPRYDFNWQTRYEFLEPIAAPKGSRIDCVAHFDNSPGNRSNPDPTRLVKWGPQTWDEMMIGFIEYTLDHQQLQPTLQKPAQQRSTDSRQPLANAPELRPAEALPGVDQVLAKQVEALGGKTAIQSRTSRVTKGTMSVPAFGATGTIEIYEKAPNKQLITAASSMLGTWRLGFNGAAAWEDEDGQVKETSAFAKRDADFYLPLRMKELFPRIEMRGKEKVGDRDAYCLEAPRAGKPKRWYFDTETGLLVRTEVRNEAGALISSEDYADYRVVDTVKVAFSVRRIDPDGTEIIIKVNAVEHNVTIEDGKFEKPSPKAEAQVRK